MGISEFTQHTSWKALLKSRTFRAVAVINCQKRTTPLRMLGGLKQSETEGFSACLVAGRPPGTVYDLSHYAVPGFPSFSLALFLPHEIGKWLLPALCSHFSLLSKYMLAKMYLVQFLSRFLEGGFRTCLSFTITMEVWHNPMASQYHSVKKKLSCHNKNNS